MVKEMMNMEEKGREEVLTNINNALKNLIAFHTKLQKYKNQNNNIDYAKISTILGEFNEILENLENEKNELEKDLTNNR